jgi:outer membrane immunogenic protein
MKKILLAGAALLAVSVGPVLADDVPGGALAPGMQLAQMPPPPMASPAMAWSGCYVGLNGGGAFANSTFRWTNILEAPTAFAPGAATVLPAAANKTLSDSGFLGGGQAGCNFAALPSIVLGFEGDFDGVSLSTSRSATSLGNTNGGPATIVPGAIREKFSQNWFSTARARVGYATGSLLFYGTGGLAISNASFFDQVCFGPTAAVPSCNTKSTGSTRVGWTAGAGLEWLLNPAWSVKLEYLYANLGSTASQSVAVVTATGVTVPAATINHNHTLDDNIVRVGFNYHFAPPPPPPAPMAQMAPPPAAPVVFIVFFDWDKDSITPEGMQIVQQAASAYKSGAPVQIQVTGYTDRSGSAGYNQRLSERRANNVAKAMAALGVPREQMMVSGHGENDNRVPTADGVREPQNRRVEIVKS